MNNDNAVTGGNIPHDVMARQEIHGTYKKLSIINTRSKQIMYSKQIPPESITIIPRVGDLYVIKNKIFQVEEIDYSGSSIILIKVFENKTIVKQTSAGGVSYGEKKKRSGW